MKKIVFFANNLNIGGMEKSLVALLNELVNSYEVCLILEDKSGPLLHELNKKIKVKEYTLFNYNSTIIRRGANYLKRLIWTIKNYNKYDFSCNYATYSRLGSKLALKASKNNAIYVHSNYPDVYKNHEKLGDFYNYIELFKFKKIIFVSNESCKKSVEAFPEIKSKSTVINNLLAIKDIKLKQKNTSKNNVILFLGRLDDSSKNLTILIDAVNKAKQEKLNIKVWIVGDGPDKRKYIDYVNLLKLNDYIKFYKSTSDPYNYINECNSIILTSKFEGFPVVYMEALYFKKNIITTISTSEKYLDIKDYAILCDQTSESIFEGIKKSINYKKENKINFADINKKKIRDLNVLIEDE